jgi:NADH-quinone oxidoreductase subunit N
MSAGEFTPQMFAALLPEMGLVILALVLMGLDLLWKYKEDLRAKSLSWITAGGLVVIMALAVFAAQPDTQGELVWGGMLRFDQAGFVFRLVFLCGAAMTALFASQYEWLRARGEFYTLLLISTLGMCLVASSADLIMLYLAIETTAIPLYVLSGFLIRKEQSVEAGIKYLLFGAMTSAIMLYGFSLLYGITGTTQMYAIRDALAGQSGMSGLLIGVMALVMVGLAFKISAAPFHFWAPDVYQGAPTPVSGFLSTASKAAGFAGALRILQVVFADQGPAWSILIAILATASMLLGNYLALAQKNMKRLLAYSSIAQAGYILIGLAAGTEFGGTATVYYLIAYLVTNLAAFGIVSVVENRTGSDEIAALSGLSRRAPALALAMLAAMLSLGGVPPFAGFFSKLLVFGAAVDAHMYWLVIVGIFNAVISLYYYLKILKVMYLDAPAEEKTVPAQGAAWKVALGICVLGIFLLGIWFAPWYSLSQGAALALWAY